MDILIPVLVLFAIALVCAVLMPEVFDVDVCGETGVPIRHRHVAGYHVELLYMDVKECAK